MKRKVVFHSAQKRKFRIIWNIPYPERGLGWGRSSASSSPALRSDAFGTECGDLVCGAVFRTVRCHFGVNPALQASPNGDHIPCVAQSYLLCGPPPDDTGQIICSVESSGYCQHGITDLPTQGGSAESRLPAERAFQIYIIHRLTAFNANRRCKHEDQ